MKNPAKPSILFICTANIIRSPIADAILSAKFKRFPPLADWEVGSAGVYGQKGDPADPTAQLVMRARGYDLSQHKSCRVSAELVTQFDLVLTMEAGHKEILLEAYPEQMEKIFFFGEIAGTAEDVYDPRAGTRLEYETAIENINRLIERSFIWILVLAKYNHEIREDREPSNFAKLEIPSGAIPGKSINVRPVLDALTDSPTDIKYKILHLLVQIYPQDEILRQEIESVSHHASPTKEEENWLLQVRLMEIVQPISCRRIIQEDTYRHPEIQKKLNPILERLNNPNFQDLYNHLEKLYTRNLPAFKYRLGIWDLKTNFSILPFRVGDYEEAYTILRKRTV